MRRSTWHVSDKTFNRPKNETGQNWMKTDQLSDGIYSEQQTFCKTRTPRKQYLCHLVSEFEKCTQLSDDMLMLGTEVDQLRRGLEATQCSIDDLKFENQLSADKLKFISQDLQDIKSNHFKLRDEVSKEFRKTYKKIGVIDKEIDVMKYRQNMATKKNKLEIESLRWEFSSAKSNDTGYYVHDIPSTNTYFGDTIKREDTTLNEYSI